MYMFQMAKRLFLETDKRLLWKLAWNMGVKGMLSVERHKRRLKRGEVFPPFLYVSIINSCNLRCQGCWVDVAAKQEIIQPDAFDKLVSEAKEMGNVFFGIVGGEPFMHPHLLDMLERHPDCYFQVFTNGHFITDARGKRPRKVGEGAPPPPARGPRAPPRRPPRPPRRPEKDAGGPPQLPQEPPVHRRLHQPVPDEHRRPADRGMGRPPDRQGGDVH